MYVTVGGNGEGWSSEIYSVKKKTCSNNINLSTIVSLSSLVTVSMTSKYVAYATNKASLRIYALNKDMTEWTRLSVSQPQKPIMSQYNYMRLKKAKQIKNQIDVKLFFLDLLVSRLGVFRLQ